MVGFSGGGRAQVRSGMGNQAPLVRSGSGESGEIVMIYDPKRQQLLTVDQK